MSMRRTWEETCANLRARGYIGGEVATLGPDNPEIPARRPHPSDDTTTGLSLYRTYLKADLSGLTLPRLFICRSHIEESAFAESDLSESWMCWNLIRNTDFSFADLRGADLRASEFDTVQFLGADLGGADLRHAVFQNCAFDGALLHGAQLTRMQGADLRLTGVQRSTIAWADDAGGEPDGG